MNRTIVRLTLNIFGLSMYNSTGQFDRFWMLWSLFFAGFVAGGSLIYKFCCFHHLISEFDDYERIIPESLWNFNYVLNVLGYLIRVYSNFTKRIKWENVLLATGQRIICPAFVVASFTLIGVLGFCCRIAANYPAVIDFSINLFFVLLNIISLACFCAALNDLSMEFDKVGRFLKTRGIIAYRQHSKLIELSEDLNRVYEFELVALCASMFFTFVVSLHSLITYVILTYFSSNAATMRDDRFQVAPPLVASLQVVHVATLLACLISRAEKISKNADSFYVTLCDLMREDKSLRNNDILYMYVLVRQPVQITCSGFFDVGYRLIMSFVSGATTYIVIFLQFST